MGHLRSAIAASAVLLTQGIASGRAAAAPPPGHDPAYGPAPHYAVLPCAYGPPPQYGPARAYVAPPHAYGVPRGYDPLPEYSSAPPPGYGPLPHAMPHDRTARLKIWHEIADSLTQAVLQVRLASFHDRSKFVRQHATRLH
jgi:hypothetical protein